MMLDLLVSSKSASNCHNNTGNRKKNLSVKTAVWKGDPQPPVKVFYLLSLQIFSLIFTFG